VKVPERARIVIIGGGICGASVAYHLTERGITDVVVLEQGDLISGTTSHAPGLVGQLRSSVTLTKMLMYSVSLYRTLEVDGTPGYFEVGGVRLASSKERLQEIKQQSVFAEKVGLEAHLITPSEALNLFPLMDATGLEGALYLPSDGSATAPVLARALINRSQARGVTFCPNTRVQSLRVVNGQIKGVDTINGAIETETLVMAVGIWSPLVAAMTGIAVPLTPMQHQYAATNSLPELAGKTLPNLRDPDKLIYMRQRDDVLVIGGYERDPRVFSAQSIPDNANPTVQQFDADHFEPLRRAAAERVPVLKTAGFSQQVNGLESFTADGEFLIGPSHQVRGLWAACGFCAHGVSGSGGVGKVLADWIVDGKPEMDVSAMALDRFADQPLDTKTIEQKACQIYSTYYDLCQPVH